MKFRLFSDLHFEFNKHTPIPLVPQLDDEANMVVILAGDIFPYVGWEIYPSLATNAMYWINDVCKRHRHVVYVAGNHEHYGWDISDTTNDLKTFINSMFTNMSVLENDSITFDNVTVLGATMWTNYYDENPQVMFDCQRQMRDCKAITNVKGPQYHNSSKIPKIIPSDMLPIHYFSKNFIFDSIKSNREKGNKIVVVTHHAPSALSIDEHYVGHPCNGGYVNDLSEEFLNNVGPDVWCHGHVHSSNDYTLGMTRVLSNPYGIGIENTEKNRNIQFIDNWFKIDFTFEV